MKRRRTGRRATIAFACSLAAATAPAQPAENLPPTTTSPSLWPGFRGPGGTGVARSAAPPASWNAGDGTNIVWKTEVARHGMSSPVVAGSRVFLTAADFDVRQVLCYDADDGGLLWHHDVAELPEEEIPFVLEETGYAAPTPVTDGRHVVALFGTGELVAVDLDGGRVWSRMLDVPDNYYGHASSLLAHGDLVIVQYDGRVDAAILAFETATGKPAWKTGRSSISWSSPIAVEHRGRSELVLADCKGVDAYNPETGDHLWRVECLAGEVAPSAAYSAGSVFVASEGSGATAIEISEPGNPRTAWHWDGPLPDAASPLAAGGLLIVPTSFGAVTCLDAGSGTARWEHKFATGFNSSPVAAGDNVFLTDTSGTTQVFKLAETFTPVGTGELGESVYATPAFVGGRVYLRGIRHLFCVGDTE